MGRNKLPEKEKKSKVIRFRVEPETYSELDKIAKELDAGTAHTFVRALAERVISAGSPDQWSVNNEDA